LQVLTRCIRIVPHDKDTGGFFIALLRKVKSLPYGLVQGAGDGADEDADTATAPEAAAAATGRDFGGTGCLYQLSAETKAHIKRDTGLSDKGLAMLVARSPNPAQCWIASDAAQALGARLGVRTVGGGVPALRLHPRGGAPARLDDSHYIDYGRSGSNGNGNGTAETEGQPRAGEWRLCQEGVRTLVPQMAKKRQLKLAKEEAVDLVRLGDDAPPITAVHSTVGLSGSNGEGGGDHSREATRNSKEAATARAGCLLSKKTLAMLVERGQQPPTGACVLKHGRHYIAGTVVQHPHRAQAHAVHISSIAAGAAHAGNAAHAAAAQAAASEVY